MQNESSRTTVPGTDSAGRRLRVCLLCVEIFAWGKFGGFGRATRTIGRELVKAGHDVTVIVPRREEQQEQESLDGMTVFGYSMYKPWQIRRLVRLANADIYHSCEPSFATFVAQITAPERGHVVTVRDPRTIEDWRIEMSLPSVSKFQVAKNFLFEHSSLVSWAVRKADAVFTAYRDAMPKVDRMYRLPAPSQFLPTPIGIPPQPAKSDHPVVCYIGRLDRRKRPQLLIPVARKFPDVKFVIAGSSRDKAWEAELATGFASLPNVRQLGFVDQFRSPLHQETLEQSWIFANTAKREGLPNSFIEAAANGCAILSSNDPDGFASRFGEHVADDDFTAGLERLLAEDRWRWLGAAGRSYVASTFATELAIQNHVEAYNRVLTTD